MQIPDQECSAYSANYSEQSGDATFLPGSRADFPDS